jgi:hypothetical protein
MIYEKYTPKDRLYEKVFPSNTNFFVIEKSLVIDMLIKSYLRL